MKPVKAWAVAVNEKVTVSDLFATRKEALEWVATPYETVVPVTIVPTAEIERLRKMREDAHVFASYVKLISPRNLPIQLLAQRWLSDYAAMQEAASKGSEP